MNKNARFYRTTNGTRTQVGTTRRDDFAMNAFATTQRRGDRVSLTGMEIQLESGQVITFNGHEARTLQRLLSKALDS